MHLHKVLASERPASHVPAEISPPCQLFCIFLKYLHIMTSFKYGVLTLVSTLAAHFLSWRVTVSLSQCSPICNWIINISLCAPCRPKSCQADQRPRNLLPTLHCQDISVITAAAERRAPHFIASFYVSAAFWILAMHPAYIVFALTVRCMQIN